MLQAGRCAERRFGGAHGRARARAGIIWQQREPERHHHAQFQHILFIALAFPAIAATFGAMSEYKALLGISETNVALGFSLGIAGLTVIAVILFILIKKTFRWW